jgi:polysaccharide biosynthesis/export protein
MSRYRYVLCIAVLLCLVLGAQYSVSSYAAAAQIPTLQPKPSANSQIYIIKPNDILEISVWKEPTVSRNQVLVRPDGRIAIPLAQDVQAAGLNPTQLKQKLEQLLKDQEAIEEPNVTVIVTSIQSYVIYVTGSVTKPGPIASPTPLNVIQALTTAGTFTQFAKPKEIVIIRGADEDTRRYKFDWESFWEGKNDYQNIRLESGDVINVP